MDYELRPKQISSNQQFQPTFDNIDYKIHTTKKPLNTSKDFQPDQSSLTYRVQNHQQQQKPTYHPPYHNNSPQRQQNTYDHTQRIYSQSNDCSQYQFLIYQNKIHLLTDRLQCYMDEVQNLKKTNAILITKLSTIQSLNEELDHEKLKNLQLRQHLETYRDSLDHQKNTHDVTINELKLKLEEKDHFIELMQQENNKIIKKKDLQIQSLKQALRQKTSQLDTYQKQIHNMQIQRLNTSEDFSSRESLYTKNWGLSQYNARNSQTTNTINMQQSTVSVEEKAKQFVRKNQNELKIAMKSISQAQKCLEMGGQEISTIMVDKENEKSLINLSQLSRFKVNKTYYK